MSATLSLGACGYHVPYAAVPNKQADNQVPSYTWISPSHPEKAATTKEVAGSSQEYCADVHRGFRGDSDAKMWWSYGTSSRH